MNYLAHLYLSDNDSEIRFGNFIGDAIKGNDYLKLPLNIQKGILLHRNIDTFTDQHQLIKEAKKYVTTEIGHYKGVVIDVFFDHYLSKNWTKYHSEPLNVFLEKVKNEFEIHKMLLSTEKMLYYEMFLKRTYLYEYQTFEGVEKTLLGLERRINFKAPLSKGVLDLQNNYSDLEIIFFEFFEEIQIFVKDIKTFK